MPPGNGPVSALDERARKLVRAIQTLSAQSNLEKLAEVVSQAARDLTGADGSTIAVMEGSKTYYVGESAIAPLFKGSRFPSQNCISGWAINNQSIVVIPDIANDERIPISSYEKTFVTSLAIVPVRSETTPAAIGVYWENERAATEEELELLQCLADSTALSLNAILRLSEQRAKLKAASEVSRLKDEFLSMVSHELRTPLNGVLGWATLISHKDDLRREEIELAVGTICHCGHELKRLVDDLLEASSIMRGEFRTTRRRLRIRDLVEQSILTVSPMAHESNIALQTHFDASADGLIVLADRIRLCKALENALNNAIKFSAQDNSVRISCSRSDDHARIEIVDNGIGIDPAFIQNVFERFQQQDSSYSRKHGGLGLGMYLARHYIEEIGGKIEAFSEGVNKGAKFVIELPASAASVADKDEPQPNGEAYADLHGIRAIILDDSKLDLGLLKRMLSLIGGEAIACSTTDETLIAVASENADVLICDIGMPGESGLDFIRRLRRAKFRQSAIPAVALTVYVSEADKYAALEAGFNAFCRKPVEREELAAALREAL